MTKIAITLLAALLAPWVAPAQFSSPVRDVENPARTPFSLFYTCVNQSCSTMQTIPVGMRFVVETVSGALVPNAPTSEPRLFVEGRIDSTYFYLSVPALRGGYTNGVIQALVFCSPVRLYTDFVPVIELPGGNIDNSYTTNARHVSLIGYLVKK